MSIHRRPARHPLYAKPRNKPGSGPLLSGLWNHLSGLHPNGEILHERTEHKSVYQSTKHPDVLIHHCIETRHVVAIDLGIPDIVDDCNYINRRDLNTWESHEIGTQIKTPISFPSC